MNPVRHACYALMVLMALTAATVAGKPQVFIAAPLAGALALSPS